MNVKVTNVFNWYFCFNQDKCFFVIRNSHFKAFFTQTFSGHTLLLGNFHYLKGFWTHTDCFGSKWGCTSVKTFASYLFHAFTFANSVLDPVCISAFRISSRLWAYLNSRTSFSQYPVGTTTLTPVFRKTQKAETTLGTIFWENFTNNSHQREDWWGTGFQADEVPPAPPSAAVHHHADGAWRDRIADIWNSLHLQGLPQVSFEKGDQRPPLSQYKVLKLSILRREERKCSNFYITELKEELQLQRKTTSYIKTCNCCKERSCKFVIIRTCSSLPKIMKCSALSFIRNRKTLLEQG